MMPLIVSKVSRPLKSALWIRLMFLCLCLGFPTPGAYSFSLRSHCFRSTAPTLRAPGAFALRSEASLRPPLQAHFASPQEGFRLDLDSRYFRNQSLRGGPGTVARLQPAGHHRAAHRGAQSRAQRGGVLHEAVFCDRGGVSVGALCLQSSEPLPESAQPTRALPTTGNAPECGVSWRPALVPVGRKPVLHISSAWVGFEKYYPLVEAILERVIPTSPPLPPTADVGEGVCTI